MKNTASLEEGTNSRFRVEPHRSLRIKYRKIKVWSGSSPNQKMVHDLSPTEETQSDVSHLSLRGHRANRFEPRLSAAVHRDDASNVW